MVIQELSALDFRNFSELRISFGDRINILVGQNGQGKTNLAEALYFLLHLDSFRTHDLSQLIRQSCSVAQAQGLIESYDMVDKSRVELSRKGRRIWWNDHPVDKLLGYVNRSFSVVFSPDLLHLYRHVPGERRLFYNRYLSFLDLEYVRELVAFRQVHAQKNSLLRSGNLSGIEAWNRLFAQRGRAIMLKRAAAVEELNGELSTVFSALTGRSEVLRLNYAPSFKGDAAQIEAQLNAAQEQEARLGHALVGPQRDDFRFSLMAGPGGGDAAHRRDTQFSQGEFRASLLALLLALDRTLERRKGFRPIVILDDAFSELDARVREAVATHLLGMPNQIFITTTERLEPFQAAGARVMEIRAGQVVS
jgi:DNA replication and repair protein RecF